MRVCFGGGDPTDFTGKTVDCIANEPSIWEIIVIAGSSYTETELLKETIKKHAHIQLKKNLDAAAMVKLMQHAQLAIVPSSTISLEALACNMLIITGITAQNQHNIYKGLIYIIHIMEFTFSFFCCWKFSLPYVINVIFKLATSQFF